MPTNLFKTCKYTAVQNGQSISTLSNLHLNVSLGFYVQNLNLLKIQVIRYRIRYSTVTVTLKKTIFLKIRNSPKFRNSLQLVAVI
jgi:hypothetical protein